MKELIFTKSGEIKTIVRFYDPLGLISSFAVRTKIILQDTWKVKVDWANALPSVSAQTFQDWFEELLYMDEIYVQHLFLITGMVVPTVCQLNIFVDESK